MKVFKVWSFGGLGFWGFRCSGLRDLRETSQVAASQAFNRTSPLVAVPVSVRLDSYQTTCSCVPDEPLVSAHG